jgi:hypothetical protein
MYSGIWGRGDRQFRGDERVGGVPLFSALEKENMFIYSIFEYCWGSDGAEILKNRSNRPFGALFLTYFKRFLQFS